jgi:hypothetical protein
MANENCMAVVYGARWNKAADGWLEGGKGRTFWPPDRLIPLSPISVRSPSASDLKSSERSQAARTRSYFSLSYGAPNSMLSRTFIF